MESSSVAQTYFYAAQITIPKPIGNIIIFKNNYLLTFIFWYLPIF